MGMSAGPSSGGGGAAPMVDINTTPLVDVMLVLLIIFMITAPLLAHKVRINLPQQSTDPADKSKIEQKRLELRDLGGAVEIRLNNDPISQEVLFAEFREMGRKEKDDQPEYKLEADETVPYSAIASILSKAKVSRIERIGFDNLATPTGGGAAPPAPGG
jgi:biopolymer transport protein ExbD